MKFEKTAAVNEYLRDRTLTDKKTGGLAAIAPAPGDAVLASSDGIPIWIQRRTNSVTADFVSAIPEELALHESLRDHLSAGRFIGLLPLVQFLRELTEDRGWIWPPLRACFIVDDPNLHRPSYGYLNFSRLAAHAARHNYHATIATIPIDSWLVNRHVARLFRDHSDRISLTVHGNNHVYHELSRLHSESRCVKTLAQALRRIERLERKAELSVSRIMVAPHDVCDQRMARALARVGMEGISINPLRLKACQSRAVDGVEPAQFVAGGVPVFARRGLDCNGDELCLSAFLRQPIILYTHHESAAHDLARLAERAAEINSLGAVHWMNIGELARSNYVTRRDADTLFVRLYSRHVSVALPTDTQTIVVETTADYDSGATDEVLVSDTRTTLQRESTCYQTNPILRPARGQIDITLRRTGFVDHRSVAPPPITLWPICRRLLTETRDRFSPMLDSDAGIHATG